jgi:predicted secreted hydrolase
MNFLKTPVFHTILISIALLLNACAPQSTLTAEFQTVDFSLEIPEGFTYADGSRPLTFPADFGAHPDFRTEWWYYTGNLSTPDDRPFGFELTVFRVGLVPPTVDLPDDSAWYGENLYFAHFALSDIAANEFHTYERYSRPGPGLAGAQASPYRVWLEDWSIVETGKDTYRLQAAQDRIAIDLNLTDEMGVILHGENGYSRKGQELTNASYYYSQPRLRAEGTVQVQDETYQVSGLAWKDHEFSTGVLDKGQIGWDWFSLQFDDGSALMLFQLRESGGGTSDSSSGTFIHADGLTQSLQNENFSITVLDQWRSPHTGGMYPSAWQIQLEEPKCELNIHPWMADQEINFPAFTYWEGAVRFEGMCAGKSVSGNGYIELTGYAGNLPLP